MADKRDNPKYTMAGKYDKSADKNGSPGPDSYNIPSKAVEKQGKTFGIKLKGSMDDSGLAQPGPGQYNNDKNKKDNYQYSMGAKLQTLTNERNPGPGAYTHKGTLEVPSSKFGTGQRSSLNPNEKGSPGPGQHSPNF